MDWEEEDQRKQEIESLIEFHQLYVKDIEKILIRLSELGVADHVIWSSESSKYSANCPRCMRLIKRGTPVSCILNGNGRRTYVHGHYPCVLNPDYL